MDSVFPKPFDADIQDVAESVAIVVNGNNAPKAISSGQYLFIKNHSTLATGGYHATAAIGSGDAISSSNVAADADGIVNAAYASLNSNIGILSNLTTSAKTSTVSAINELNSSKVPILKYPESDIDWVPSDPELYCLIMGLSSNTAYCTIVCGWIRIQFKFTNNLSHRCKYGSSSWSSWVSDG